MEPFMDMKKKQQEEEKEKRATMTKVRAYVE